MFKDRNGQILQTGTHVRWALPVPTSLLRDLPMSDRKAIQHAEGMTVEGNDEFGNIELGFRDRSGSMHWIWVNSEFVVAE